MRQRITLEAARIMAEEHEADYYRAKHKAAERLGAPNTRNLPRNEEVEIALTEYQRLFRAHRQPQWLRTMRLTAIEMMERLKHFHPRLVGPVLRGTADEHSVITLHVFADTPEEVGWFLLDQHLSYLQGERRLGYANGDHAVLPSYQLMVSDIAVELVVFAHNGLRQAPKSEVDGRPVQRAGLADVRALVNQDNQDNQD